MVVETMVDYWKKVKKGNPPSFLKPIDEEISRGAKHLINSIRLTNIVIHEAQKKPRYHRMGSTISAVLVEKDCIWAANVGDSPIYLFENSHLIQISEEHSIEAEQKAMGLSDTLGSTNPMMRHTLTRVMGMEETVKVYINPLNLDEGDIILICSDGLTDYLSEKAITTVLDDFSISIERKANVLIDEANRGGGGDNISVILLEVMSEGRWRKFARKFIG
jgi:protein phosphatase